MIPTDPDLFTTSVLAVRVGVSRKRLREWVRRRLLTPAMIDRNGCYLWRVADIAVAARVRDEYRARLGRLAAAVGQNDLAPSR